MLIAIVKKELQLDASLYTCLQILSVSIFEKTELSCALHPDEYTTEPPIDANQLNLPNIYLISDEPQPEKLLTARKDRSAQGLQRIMARASRGSMEGR